MIDGADAGVVGSSGRRGVGCAGRATGANFGVVTAFEYRLHPVGPLLGGRVIHSFSRARDVLRFYREFAAAQPDELTTYAGVSTSPDGDLVVGLTACYAGPLDEDERALAPLRRFGPPVVDTVLPMPYTAMQAMMDEGFPPGRLNYWKAGRMREISDGSIEVIHEHAPRIPSPYSGIVFADNHGAFSRVDPRATAYVHRDTPFGLFIMSNWLDPTDSECNVGWTRELFAALQPHLARGVYVNGLDRDDGEDRVRSAYGVNYERLARLKTRYDPTNLFRVNHNIKPSASDHSIGQTP